MGCNTGGCNKTSTPLGIFCVTLSLVGWPAKAKMEPSHREVRLALLDTKSIIIKLKTIKTCCLCD